MRCLVISGASFALPETVKTPTLITEQYGSPEYTTAFINKVSEYQNVKKYSVAIMKALGEIQKHSWKNIAAEWDKEFDRMFNERYDRHRVQIHKQLGYMSDYVTWSKIDASFDETIIEEVKKNNFSYDYFVSLADAKVEDLKNISSIPTNPRQQMMVDLASAFIERKSFRGNLETAHKLNLTVLELGCYDGVISGNLYKKFPEQIEKLIGYDGSADALYAYKEIWGKNPGCTNIETINDNVTNLAAHNLKADIIFVGELLEHLVDYKKMLEEINACLNKGGLVVFSTPSGPWSWIELKENKKTYHNDFHLQHYELLDLLTIFKDHRQENKFFAVSPPTQMFNYRGDACGHFVFGYYNNSEQPFYEFDTGEKAIKTRPYVSISTCMIVRNEENNLYRCLNSVKLISDEIVIVDTGSTDHTKQIALQYTDKVYDLKWEEEDGIGNFERARNFGLDKATGDWIFYLDADEELMHGNELAHYIRSEYVKCANVLQKQILVEGVNAHDQCPNRLFKRGDFRFYGVLHELPKQYRDKENDALEITTPPRIRLNHIGYLDNEIRLDKIRRNAPLLEKNIRLYPTMLENHLYTIRNLVHYYQFNKETKYLYSALEAWDDYPEGISSKKEVDAWLDTFVYIQIARKELVEHDDFVAIKRKGMFFASNKEFKLFKELAEIRDLLRRKNLLVA